MQLLSSRWPAARLSAGGAKHVPTRLPRPLQQRAAAVRARGAATATELPPSSRTAASELDALAACTGVIPDTLSADGPLAAATVSLSLLRSVLASGKLGFVPLRNAIVSGLSYDGCAKLADAQARRECCLDKAMANVGALLLARVADDGRVATQLDPRLANDTGALVSRARHLASLYGELGVASSRLVFRLPATWAAIQAARQLEQDGLATQVYYVYSLAQGVAAMQAGASVLQVAVGSTREYYDKHPGAIRDPKGPRQDAGGGGGADPGLRLVADLYAYARRHHPHTRIIASAIRTREDALALSGCDWMVLSRRVAEALAATPTGQGYNDGLSAQASADAPDIMTPALTPATAAKAAPQQLPPYDERSFSEGLGPCAAQLTAAGLQGQLADVSALMDELRALVPGSD